MTYTFKDITNQKFTFPNINCHIIKKNVINIQYVINIQFPSIAKAIGSFPTILFLKKKLSVCEISKYVDLFQIIVLRSRKYKNSRLSKSLLRLFKVFISEISN